MRCLSPAQLQALTDGQPLAQRHPAHLATCPRCQAALTQTQKRREWARHTLALLNPTPADCRTPSLPCPALPLSTARPLFQKLPANPWRWVAVFILGVGLSGLAYWWITFDRQHPFEAPGQVRLEVVTPIQRQAFILEVDLTGYRLPSPPRQFIIPEVSHASQTL